MQRLVLIVLIVLLLVCAVGNLRAESAILFRIGLIAAALAPVCAVCWFGGGAGTYPYLLSCVLAVLLRFAQVSSGEASDLARWFFVLLNLVSAALLIAWAARTPPTGLSEVSPAAGLRGMDAWVVSVGFVLGVGLFLKGFLISARNPGFLLRSLGSGLSVIHFAVLVVAGARLFRLRLAAKAFSLALFCVLLFILGAGAVRCREIGVFVNRAVESREAGDVGRAREWMDKAIRANETLRWKSLSERVALADCRISIQEGKPREALENLLRYMRDRHERAFLRKVERLAVREYFELTPLAPMLDKRSHSETYGFFPDLHAQLDRDPVQTEYMHRLFLLNGYLDRLEERYATAGFPEIRERDLFLEALEQFRQSHPDRDAEARRLAGALLFQWGRYGEAREAFEAVLAARPADTNAIVFLERLARREGNALRLEELNRKVRVIEYQEMQGNHRGKYQLQHVFWCALEGNPGRYEIELELRGKPALGVWPQLEVFLGDSKSPIFSGAVEPENWTRVKIEARFSEEGRRRLLLLFANDFYQKGVEKSVTENRNLEFRKGEIRYSP